MAQLLRPLRANLGAVAAVGVGAGLVYAYAKPKPPTVFGGFNPQYLRLDSVEQVNHNTKRLRFAFPNPDDLSGLPLTSAVLTFSKPSSHLLPVLRPYTPITHASTPGHLDLLVKHYPSGKQSTHLHSLAPGDSLAFVTAIPGYAWQRNRFRRIACIAGGAGVTPVWQLVQGILADPDDKTVVDVVYGANSVEDVLLREEWGRLVEKSRGRLRVHYTVSRGGEEGGEFRKGYVTKELLRELGVEGGKKGEEEETSMVFVCGPPKMEEALVGKGRGGSGGILAELGFRKEQVYKF